MIATSSPGVRFEADPAQRFAIPVALDQPACLHGGERYCPFPKLDRMPFPATRMRRLRRSETLRGLVRETELSPSHLIQPLFVVAGEGIREPVAVDAGGRALLDQQPGRGGGRGRRRRGRRGDAVRDPRRQGRVRHRRLRRRGDRADGGAGAEGRPSRPRRDDRRLPLRVHLARPLRRLPRGLAGGRQRPLGRAAGENRDLARRGRRRRGRAERHDGRPGRRDPLPARRGGPQRRADHRLQRQVRLRLLRAVPRRRRVDAGIRRPPRLPDGSGQRARSGARGRARPRRGRRHADGEAGDPVPRRGAAGQGRHRRPGRRLPRLRRVLDAEGGRRERLARRAGGGAGDADRDPPRRRRRDHHLLREGGRGWL